MFKFLSCWYLTDRGIYSVATLYLPWRTVILTFSHYQLLSRINKKFSLRKIPWFHITTWCGNLRKGRASAEKHWWNYGILRSVCQCRGAFRIHSKSSFSSRRFLTMKISLFQMINKLQSLNKFKNYYIVVQLLIW